MALRDTIKTELKDAMRAKDELKLATLRLIMATIKDRDIAARGEDRCSGISDDEIMQLLAKMVKQREDSAKTYEDACRPELAERERAEIEIIRAFMPRQLSDDEIQSAVKSEIEAVDATGLKDMGKIMGALKSKYAGQIDMGKAGGMVKALLS